MNQPHTGTQARRPPPGPGRPDGARPECPLQCQPLYEAEGAETPLCGEGAARRAAGVGSRSSAKHVRADSRRKRRGSAAKPPGGGRSNAVAKPRTCGRGGRGEARGRRVSNLRTAIRAAQCRTRRLAALEEAAMHHVRQNGGPCCSGVGIYLGICWGPVPWASVDHLGALRLPAASSPSAPQGTRLLRLLIAVI